MYLVFHHFKSIQLPGEKDKDTIHRLQPIMLRRALQAASFDIPSAPLTVLRTPKGKPYLPDYPSFHYNFSDSGDYLALAASCEHPVGVDLQQITVIASGVETLAGRFYHPQDAALVLSFQGEEQLRTFFRIWTIQEAYLKCIGQGLTYGLDHQFVNFSDQSIGGRHFQEMTPPEDGYCLAVCE